VNKAETLLKNFTAFTPLKLLPVITTLLPVWPFEGLRLLMLAQAGDSNVKLAASVIGPFIVKIAGLLEPVKAPDPLPVQPLKLNPLFAKAETLTLWPLLKYPLDGVTVPPVPALIVKKY
jgi:hypothetical protein